MDKLNTNKSINKKPLLNSSGINDVIIDGKARMFDNPYLIGIILLLTIVFIIYAIINHLILKNHHLIMEKILLFIHLFSTIQLQILMIV